MAGPRPIVLYWGLALVFVWGLLAGMWGQIESAATARTLRVVVTLATGADAAGARLIYDTLGEDGIEAVPAGAGAGVAVWEVEGRWVRGFRLALPAAALAALTSVEVVIGDASENYDRERLVAGWRRATGPSWRPELAGGRVVLEAPAELRAAPSRLAAGRGMRNWPGDGRFAARALLVAAAATAVAFLLSLVGRALASPGRLGAVAAAGLRIGERSEDQPAAPGAPRRAAPWLGFGLAVVAAAALVLELRDPYYFTQDDNFAQFLPIILHGCSVLAGGAFPDFNPFQQMGAPVAGVGVYALTYPPTWASCAIADRLLGTPAAALEVFAFLHLAAGFGAAFWAGRAVGVRPALAAAAALSFALSGYFLIGGRSWYYMLPVALWAPLLVVAVERLRRGTPGLGWAVLSGLAVGAFFHAGNAQMWSYAMLFVALALALSWSAGELPPRKLMWAAAALLIGVAVAAPLLVVQWSFAAGVERQGGGGLGILEGLAAMLLPYPLARAQHPNGWGNLDLELMGHFYYAGTLIIGAGVVALSGLVALALAGRLPRRALAPNLWLVCGAVALLFALGNYTPLWGALAKLPGFDKFNHPFKFLPFVVLFLSLGGARFLENQLRAGTLRAAWAPALAAATAALMLLHVAQARPSFYSFAEDPYPSLPAELGQILFGADGAGRVLPIAPRQTVATGYVASLAHNFASLFRLPSLEGYDTLVLNTMATRRQWARLLEDPAAAARAYGVRWLIVFDPDLVTRGARAGKERLSERQRFLAAALGAHGVVRLERPDFQLIELAGARPLAFAASAPARPLELSYRGDGVRVALPDWAAGGPVVLNFLARPGTRVLADGRPLAVTADHWGRVVVRPPAGTQTLVLGYAPPWAKGFAAALILALAAAGLLAVLRRRERRRRRGAGPEG